MERTTKDSVRDAEEMRKELRELAARPVESVREVEQRMAYIYQNYRRLEVEYDVTECIEDLRLERWWLLRDSFKWSDDYVARLEAMNERLKAALLDMRRQTIEVYEKLGNWCTSDKDLEVSGSLWVDKMTFDGWEDNEDMQESLFDIMTGEPYCGFYKYGLAHNINLYHIESRTDTPKEYDSETELLYLHESIKNWNELMPIDKTDHLHLVYAVHNLYEHCRWSIQDLLNIQSFMTKIEIEYRPRNVIE